MNFMVMAIYLLLFITNKNNLQDVAGFVFGVITLMMAVIGFYKSLCDVDRGG